LELEPGDVLETYHLIGDDLYGYKVVDPFYPTPDWTGSSQTNTEDTPDWLVISCPLCYGTDCYIIRYPTDSQLKVVLDRPWSSQSYMLCHYCKECYLAWDKIWVGIKEQTDVNTR